MNNYRFTIDTNGTLTTGLMSYYKLDSNVNDVSVQNRNGSLVGSPTFTAGKVGNGLYTDDSNYMQAPNDILSWDTINWSVSFWHIFGSIMCQGIITGSRGVSNGFRLYRGATYMYIEVYGPQGKSSTRFNHFPNYWYHVVVTGGGGFNNSPAIYINTVATSIATPMGGDYVENPMYASGVVVDVGGLQTGVVVDEYSTWDKILSAQEITDLYNAGSGQTMNPMGVASIDRIDINNLKSYRGFDLSQIKKINGI